MLSITALILVYSIVLMCFVPDSRIYICTTRYTDQPVVLFYCLLFIGVGFALVSVIGRIEGIGQSLNVTSASSRNMNAHIRTKILHRMFNKNCDMNRPKRMNTTFNNNNNKSHPSDAIAIYER